MNRKQHSRAIRTTSNVALDLYDPAKHAIVGEGRFINVSLTGSLLESRKPLRVRQAIRLQLQTPGPSPYEFVGKVVWRKKKAAVFNYGIVFNGLSTYPTLQRQGG